MKDSDTTTTTTNFQSTNNHIHNNNNNNNGCSASREAITTTAMTTTTEFNIKNDTTNVSSTIDPILEIDPEVLIPAYMVKDDVVDASRNIPTATTTTTTTTTSSIITDPSSSSSYDNNNNNKDNNNDDIIIVLERILYRLTGGLPKCELNYIIQESDECELALLEEIRILEDALHNNMSSSSSSNKQEEEEEEEEEQNQMMKEDTDTITTTNPMVVEASCCNSSNNTSLQLLHNILLESPIITPLDQYYTVSALLGRIQHYDMMIPSVVVTNTLKDSCSSSSMQVVTASSTTTTAESTIRIPSITTTTTPYVESNEEKSLAEFLDPTNPLLYTLYTKMVVDSDILLLLWKKISINRAAFVFKRPVKIEEAPGYNDRIYFPMDLSLIRKRIITNNIQTYIDFHHALALISHNCVKYNGRDSDYGRVARDFEAMVDHIIVQAVRQAAAAATANNNNMDGTSNEMTIKTGNATTNDTVIVPSTTDMNHLQGTTSNSGTMESITTTTLEPSKEDVESNNRLPVPDKSSQLADAAINDTNSKASISNAGTSDDMIT